MPQNRRMYPRRLLPLVGLLGLALAVGCGGDDDPNEATIVASEYSFTIEDALTPGVNEITLRNDGGEAHHVQFIPVPAGTTVEGLLALATAEGPPPGFAGGVGVIEPGGDASVFADLAAGSYGLLCFVENASGPHFL